MNRALHLEPLYLKFCNVKTVFLWALDTYTFSMCVGTCHQHHCFYCCHSNHSLFIASYAVHDHCCYIGCGSRELCG